MAAGLAWWNTQLDKPDSIPAIFMMKVWPSLRWWLLALAVAGLMLMVHRWRQRSSPQRVVSGIAHRSRNSDGLASPFDVWRVAGYATCGARPTCCGRPPTAT